MNSNEEGLDKGKRSMDKDERGEGGSSEGIRVDGLE